MTIKTAMILAAGRGTRLSSSGEFTPKGLVEVGVEDLVSRSVRQLKSHGISEIVVVTGHQAELYETFARTQSGVRCVFNPQYESLGSLESLRCGLEAVTAPMLILDSDIIYESRGLDELLAEPGENAALVSGPTGSGDEYYVWSDAAKRLHFFSKHLSEQPGAPLGEHVGIIKIGPALRSALLERAPAKLRHRQLEAYETLLIDLLPEHPMGAAYVHDLAWSEIDTPEMLETARNVIWPRLKAMGDV